MPTGTSIASSVQRPFSLPGHRRPPHSFPTAAVESLFTSTRGVEATRETGHHISLQGNHFLPEQLPTIADSRLWSATGVVTVIRQTRTATHKTAVLEPSEKATIVLPRADSKKSVSIDTEYTDSGHPPTSRPGSLAPMKGGHGPVVHPDHGPHHESRGVDDAEHKDKDDKNGGFVQFGPHNKPTFPFEGILWINDTISTPVTLFQNSTVYANGIFYTDETSTGDVSPGGMIFIKPVKNEEKEKKHLDCDWNWEPRFWHCFRGGKDVEFDWSP